MKKRISPAALHALKQALTAVFWFKKDLRGFLVQVLPDSQVLGRLNWDAYKRDIVAQLVDALSRDQQRHQQTLLDLMEEVMRMEDFSHLRLLDDDGAAKAKRAELAVEALRKHAGRYADLRREKEEAARRSKAAEARRRKAVGVASRLKELREKYFGLLSMPPQDRGYALERFLPKLFELFDLDPKASFRRVGEQIDGAFVFDHADYLLEAKWWDSPVPAKELDAFSSKIGRKLDNTLGLFLSMGGFTPEGIQAYSGQRSLMICMDGADLMAVLEGRIALDVLLRRKRKRAAQRGEIYVTFAEMME